ncbi:DUF2628 domain-containing protein [Pseudorhodoferax sp. LjRoot39]|uniref:DUF2628 domain-containing protein n=1 Tax=Pseudorhodoferax sp. LjRoot39 TaxID=3342328 RepID=UPI003ECFEC3C
MSYFPKEDILEQPAARSTHRPSMRHEITAEAEYAFLGKNADYYVDEWSKIKEGSKVSFNLWACLLGPAWLAYRKMYLYTVLFVVFLELQVIAELSVGKLSPITQLVQTVITMGAFALYGNYAYLNFSREKIRNILSQKNGISVDEALEKAGGVNKWAPWAVVLFVLAFAVILSIIFPEKV